MNRAGLWVRSIPLGIGASVAYGIVHDEITIRISPAYLMDWHPTVIESRDPTLVALAWGVVATWWFGLILGVVLALAATFGRKPRAPWRWIVRALTGVFAASALAAAIALGITSGFALEMPDDFGPVYAELDRPERLAFTQAAAMHETAYDAAAITTLLSAGIIVWGRRRLGRPDAAPESGGPGP